MSSVEVENTGSVARDYCMLERNLLSHFKLALLLSLLSSSFILRTRLFPGEDHDHSNAGPGLPIAIVQLVASLAAIIAGYWAYTSDCRDMSHMKALLLNTKPHLAVMAVVAGIVFCTSIILLADENQP